MCMHFCVARKRVVGVADEVPDQALRLAHLPGRLDLEAGGHCNNCHIQGVP